jgi:hypothetical protein
MKKLSPTLAAIRVLMIVGCLCPLTLAQYDGAVDPPEKFAPGFNSITEENSQALLKVLAGEEFAGRGTGQEGYLKAAKWFAEQLEKSGWQPGGPEGSWFQTIPFIRTDIDPFPWAKTLRSKAANWELETFLVKPVWQNQWFLCEPPANHRK